MSQLPSINKPQVASSPSLRELRLTPKQLLLLQLAKQYSPPVHRLLFGRDFVGQSKINPSLNSTLRHSCLLDCFSPFVGIGGGDTTGLGLRLANQSRSRRLRRLPVMTKAGRLNESLISI
jgi:hypothetical protein